MGQQGYCDVCFDKVVLRQRIEEESLLDVDP